METNSVLSDDSACTSTSDKICDVKKDKKTKVCTICGDFALGFNFSAVSCESCKAFFRRNASKTIRGRCVGKCVITVESRAYCKKCRLNKCFAVGMKKDMILDDRQKSERRRKIALNRSRKLGQDPPSPSSSNEQIQQNGHSLSERTHVIAAEVDRQRLRGLSDVALLTIEMVMDAFGHSFDQPADASVPTVEQPNEVQFVNFAHVSIRRLVKMAKRLSHFTSLETEDQIILLKECCLEVLTLRSTTYINPSEKQACYTLHNKKVTMSFTKVLADDAACESKAFYGEFFRFVGSCLKALKGDNVSLMLLIVLCLFSPDRPNLKQPKLVEEAQQAYSDTMRAYLSHVYPEDPQAFARIVQKLTDVRNLNEVYTTMIKKMDVKDLEPIIVEIFGLSSS